MQEPPANIKKEPAWYQAVLDHPPLPLPAKAPPLRTEYDLAVKHQLSATSSKHMRPQDSMPRPVYYVEDDVRRQFFMDHPFEAFRPTTLVEGGEIEPEHPIRGIKWTRLRQRGHNPSPEEYVSSVLCFYSN